MNNCSIIDKLRGPKIFDMSIFDWVSSLLGAFLIGYYIFQLRNIIYWIIYIIIWILIGVIIHWYYSIDTMFGYYLGINKKPKRKQC
jgi:uncharacterized membrane protein YcaP (DUF421 family)